MTDKTSTVVTFLLDRSGSMHGIKAATIEGFNGYITTLKAEKETEIGLSFLTFDSQSLDKIYVNEPIANVALLTDATYQPRGGTPLIDAAVKTIRATEDAVAAAPGDPRVVVCIQTDGYENQSTEHTWEELRALIDRKTADGWQFLFMGAGIDAYNEAQRMGIGVINTMSYDAASPDATRAAFAASATNSADFGSLRAKTAAYSTGQRAEAGDKFWPGFADPPEVAPVTPSVPVMPRHRQSPKRRKSVSDFTL